MADLIKPKTVTILDLDKVERTFTISRFPSTDGREFITQFPVTASPKIGDYKSNAALSARMMHYVSVKTGDTETRLTTQALVDNHTSDAQTLIKLEWELLGYNNDFFGAGKSLSFFSMLLESLTPWATKTLMALSGALLQAVKQRSTS